MNDFLDKISDYPTMHKAGFCVLSLVFFSYVFWAFLYKEKDKQLVKLQESVQLLEGKILQERRLAQNIQKVREEVKELDIKLKFALQELPDKKELPDLLSSISDLATDAGLEINLFRPRPENLKEFYAEVPVSISVTGGYHQVATFFDEVGQLPRIVNINQIVLREPRLKETSVTLKTDCVATTFRYLEESERIKKKSNQRSRRR